MRLLEILIPTVPIRSIQLDSLKANLMNQIHANKVDISISTYNTEAVIRGGLATGLKRQILIEDSNSEYVVFIDDDDFVSDDYISEIAKALKEKPDVVTFNGYMTTDGHNRKNWEIRLDNNYDEKYFVYQRPPNHICPIKREIAIAIGYSKNLSDREDYDYCIRLRNSGLIKTSIHIGKDLYYYDYKTTQKLYK